MEPSPLRRRGFTLVELLVVIAIIALLVSILAPSLDRAKELTRRAACTSNLHEIALGYGNYAGQNNGWFIPNSQSTADRVYENTDPKWDNRDLMRQYAGSVHVYYCPSDNRIGWGNIEPTHVEADGDFWIKQTTGGVYHGNRARDVSYGLLGGFHTGGGRYYEMDTGRDWVFPTRSWQQASTDVIAFDWTISWPGGGYGSPVEPAQWNHGGDRCDGAARVRLDGSGQFNPSCEPVVRRMWGSSDSYWFW